MSNPLQGWGNSIWRAARSTEGRRPWRLLSASLLAGAALAGLAQAETSTQTVIAAGDYTVPTYTNVGTIPGFNVSYAHAPTAEALLFRGVASISQRFTNSSGSTSYPNISGNAPFALALNARSLGNFPVSVFASGVIPAHSSGTVGNTDSVSYSVAVPVGTLGAVTGTSNAGSGPNLRTLFDVYTYTPIGLTQADAIAPSSVLNNVYTFNSVPTGRWLDPPAAAAFRYQVTTPGTYLSAVTFPVGFGDNFHVVVGGRDYGPFGSGQTFNFPASTSTADLLGISRAVTPGAGDGYAALLSYTSPNATLTMTPLQTAQTPEPTAWTWLGVGAAAGWWGRRRGLWRGRAG